jgi:hypothetical protein
MSADTAAAQAAGTPEDYAARYEFDINSGQLRLAQGSQDAPAMLRNVRVTQTQDGRWSAYVPALATGDATAYRGGTTSNDWAADFMDRWEMHGVAKGNDGKSDIRKAIHYWKRDPLVYRCVRFLSILANTRLTIECEDDAFRDAVEIWMRGAMGHTFRSQFFTEFFRTGMVPIFKTLIPYVPRKYKYNKAPKPEGDGGNVDQHQLARAQADEQATQRLAKSSGEAFAAYREAVERYEQGLAMSKQKLCSEERLAYLRQRVVAAQHQWLPGSIPGAYTILDPLSVDMDGPEEFAWLREPHLNISNGLRQAVLNPTPSQREVINQMPFEVVEQIRRGKTKVWLPPNICNMVFNDKQPLERYPTPIAKHCFDAIEQKLEMIEMDRASIRSVRNRILKVTIGNDNFPVTDPEQIRKVTAIFNSPNSTMRIFWNHTLNIEWIEQDMATLLDKAKYTAVNEEIRTVTTLDRAPRALPENGRRSPLTPRGRCRPT